MTPSAPGQALRLSLKTEAHYRSRLLLWSPNAKRASDITFLYGLGLPPKERSVLWKIRPHRSKGEGEGRGEDWPHSCLPSQLPLSHSPCPSSHLALPPDLLTDTLCTLLPFHTHFQGCDLSCSYFIDKGLNKYLSLCYVYDCVNNICLHYMGTRVLRENILTLVFWATPTS